jgi:hypothetical protein
MVEQIRKAFNAAFSTEKYEAHCHTVNTEYGEQCTFRLAETPVFVPKALKQHLIKAVDEISEVLASPQFKAKSESAIPKHLRVPNEDAHPAFLQLDFGICAGPNGELYPQLIELQGFPSLYFFQSLLAKSFRQNFDIPEGYQSFFQNLDEAGYVQILRDVIIGNEHPENVVLLEIEPEKQNTRIDFWGTHLFLGTKTLCLSKVIKEGKNLFYLNDEGRKIAIKRIYNRIIFDELEKRSDLSRQWDMLTEVNAEWVGHPNWFFRMSKHTLPSLKTTYAPETHFLSDLKSIPSDLDAWVLKPLFSFSGMGVNMQVTKADIEAVENPTEWILQRKATYIPAIVSPNEAVKCEIRMMLVWPKGWSKPLLINNLVRLSKGAMVGVRYNKDKDWVGASVAFFEPD